MSQRAMTSPSFDREAIVTMSSCRCARMQRTLRPCQSVYTNGTPRALSARSRSGWISTIRNEARSPRIPAPTTPAAIRAPITPALLRAGRRREARRHLLEDAGNDPRHGLDALGDHREHDLRPVRQNEPADQVMVVVRVSRLGPHAGALRKTLAGQARVLELDVLERLLRRDVAREQLQHLLRRLRARDFAPDDLLEEPSGFRGGHSIAVLSALPKGLLSAVGVLAESLLVRVQVRVAPRAVPVVDRVAAELPLLPFGGVRDLGTGRGPGDRVDDEAGGVVGGDGDHVLDGADELRVVREATGLFLGLVEGEEADLDDLARIGALIRAIA